MTVVALAAPPAVAAFRDPATARASFATDRLQPVASLSASPGCYGGLLSLLLNDPGVSLSWSHSPSTWRDGYEVRQSTTSSIGPWTTVANLSASTTGWTARSLSGGTTYWFEVRAKRASWRSASVVRSATTPSGCL